MFLGERKVREGCLVGRGFFFIMVLIFFLFVSLEVRNFINY